ncbi:MAG: hypothetical protein FWC71_02245 [Defluviitaleaceae bacterium]|nr:hypothetical protein [Defluviitaleaceae bacterium]
MEKWAKADENIVDATPDDAGFIHHRTCEGHTHPRLHPPTRPLYIQAG